VPPQEEEDPTLGWSAVAPAGVAVHKVSGTHTTMFAEPSVIDLAKALNARIDQVEREDREVVP
jgi:thioesterase domain-containing protein